MVTLERAPALGDRLQQQCRRKASYNADRNRCPNAARRNTSIGRVRGELLICRIFVGVGSDHTDRKAETYGVTVSKQMCDKPVASVLWELEDVAGHWDQMILRSHAVIGGTRVLYQEGTLENLLPVEELIHRGFGSGGLPDGCAMFGGTFAAKGGIRPASRCDFELVDPVLKRSIRHAYDVIELPVLG